MNGARLAAIAGVVAVAGLLSYVVVGGQSKPPAATKPARVPATASDAQILALTETALDQVPALDGRPARDDETYQAVSEELYQSPVMLFIDPLDPVTLAERSLVILPRDFRAVLGREVTPAQAAQFQQEIVEDLERRRALTRRLLDLYLENKISPRELEGRAGRLRDGMVLAFRRITGITKEQHDQLTAQEMAAGTDAGP